MTLKPPPAFHLFRASVKHEVMHLVAVDRQAHERYRERLNVLRREIENITAAIALVHNITLARPVGVDGADAGVLGGAGAADGWAGVDGAEKRLNFYERWKVGEEEHLQIAEMTARVVRIRSCFYQNGWNSVFCRLMHEPIEWGRVHALLKDLHLRHVTALQV